MSSSWVNPIEKEVEDYIETYGKVPEVYDLYEYTDRMYYEGFYDKTDEYEQAIDWVVNYKHQNESWKKH